MTRYRRPDLPDRFVTEYGTGPWEAVDILPISARPGWVRVYVVLVDGAQAPWEDEDPSSI